MTSRWQMMIRRPLSRAVSCMSGCIRYSIGALELLLIVVILWYMMLLVHRLWHGSVSYIIIVTGISRCCHCCSMEP